MTYARDPFDTDDGPHDGSTWRVHVIGPDDLSDSGMTMLEAVELANAMNAQIAETMRRYDPPTVFVFAIPVRDNEAATFEEYSA